jgi:hypothetical protein
VRVFLSHSRKDAELVARTKSALQIVDSVAFALEDLPGSRTVPEARRAIETEIAASGVVFLLLTPNAVASDHTKTWIAHEVSCASNRQKKLVVFQEPDSPPSWPVTYWTDLVVLSNDPGRRPIQMQKVVKDLRPSAAPAGGVIGGAAIGAIFGPVGMIIGGLIGLGAGASTLPDQMPTLRCTRCSNSFRFWNPSGTLFYCPHCIKAYRYTI